MSKNYVAPAYMHEFRCLGGDCPDTCCKNWDIRVDHTQYLRIQSCLSSSELESEKFNNSMDIIGTTETDFPFAIIKHDKDGKCAFLDSNEYCEIHSAYGVEPLSEICAFFPRVISHYYELYEITGALSCPEVARLCMSSIDGLWAFKQSDDSLLPRQENIPVSNTLTSISSDCYEGRYVEIRNEILNILLNQDYSIETRLYSVTSFCNRLSQFYYKDCDNVDVQIESELKKIRNVASIEKLDQYVNDYQPAEPITVVVIQAILQLALQQAGDTKFINLLNKIFSGYASEIDAKDELEIYGDNIPPEQLWSEYQHRWQKLNAQHGVTIENYLMRYIVNCVQREAYYLMPDPFTFMHLLNLRIAILRFVLTSHPELISFYADDNATISEEKLLEITIETVYLFSRNIDQNHTFLTIIYQAIAEQQMMSYDYAIGFIKF